MGVRYIIVHIDNMNGEEALARLKAHEVEWKALGVHNLFLFSSTARGEARGVSNLDFFFDHKKMRLDLYELIGVK